MAKQSDLLLSSKSKINFISYMEIECAYCFEMLLVLKERTKVLKTEVGKHRKF